MKKIFLHTLFGVLLALSPALAATKSKKSKDLFAKDLGPHIWLAASPSKPASFADFLKGPKAQPAQQTPVKAPKAKSLVQKAKTVVPSLKQKANAKLRKARQAVKAAAKPKAAPAPQQVNAPKPKAAPRPRAAQAPQKNGLFNFLNKPKTTPTKPIVAAAPTLKPVAASKPGGKGPSAPKRPPISSVVATPLLSVPSRKVEVQQIDPAKTGTTELASRYAKADASKTFAAVLIYAEDQGKRQILLTRNVNQKIWSPLMGKSIPADTFITDTAERVSNNLTKGYLPLSADELIGSPSHDYITSEGNLRIYFVEQSYVPADEITAYTKSKKLFGYDFMWIPVDSLLNSTMNGPFVRLPLGWTFSITSSAPSVMGAPSLLTAQLHPRLFGALRSDGALAILNKIAMAQPIAIRATASSHIESQDEPTKLTTVPNLDVQSKQWPAVDTTVDLYKKGLKFNKEESAQLATTVAKQGNLLAEIKSKALKIKRKLKPAVPNEKSAAQDAEEYRQTLAHQRKTLKSSLTAEQKAIGNAFAAIPLSQTDAYLKFRMGDRFLETKEGDDPEVRRSVLKTNVYEFLLKYSRSAVKGKSEFSLNDTYFETLTDMYEEEVNHKDMIPFYHSTISAMAFIYDLYTEFRNQLSVAAEGKGNLALRGLDDDFMRFMDVNDFYRFFEQGKGKFNYRKVQGLAYPSLGLSTNYSIFGSDGRKKSETYTYFHDGFSRKPADSAWLFDNFAQSLGIKTSFERYSPLIDRYFENEKRNITLNPLLNDAAKRKSDIANNGRMIQIFIHPSVVDQVAHTSLPGGLKMFINNLSTNPHGFNAYSGSRYIVEAMRKNPWNFFTNDLTRAYTPTEPKEAGTYTQEDFQARILLKPEIFFNPDLVKIKTYWRHPIAAEAEYKAKLRSMVREDIQKWLASRMKAKGKVFGAKDTGQGLSLQKLYEEVLKGQAVKIDAPSIKAKSPVSMSEPAEEKSDSYWYFDTDSNEPKDTKKDPNYWYFD